MTRVPAARGARFARAVACAALASVLLALPAHATSGGTAAPLSDYASRLEAASESARSSSPRELHPEAAAALAERVTALLPDGELVALPGAGTGGGGEVRVDSSVLGGLATKLASAETARDREEALTRLQAHLASLRSALPAQRDGGARPVPSDPAALQTLLASRGSTEGPSLTERLLELIDRIGAWLSERFGSLLNAEESRRLDTTAWIVALTVLSAVLVFIAVRTLMALRKGVARKEAARVASIDTGTPVVAAAEGLPADALAYAEELAAAGEYRAAVRALFGGAARTLVEAGVIGQTRTRTDAELLAEVAPVAPAVHTDLGGLTRGFERAWYGHVDPGSAGFAEARDRYAAVVRGVTA